MRARSNAGPGPVTFAIPFYSGSSYLARAVRSIVAQRDDSWQAVVIDDGDEPGIEDLVRVHGENRVGYLKNSHNIGMAANFNRCIDVADTELVTVLHGDDELMPSYTGTMRAAAARHPEAAALFCRATIIGPDSSPRFSVPDVVKDWINPANGRDLVLAGEPGMRALLRANFIVAPTLCFRKERLGERRFPAEYKFVLDWALTTQLLLDGESLVGLSDRCYWYRRHEDNATERLTRTQLRFREEAELYDRLGGLSLSLGWQRCARICAQKRILKLNVTYRALRSAALGDLADAVRGFRLLREL